MKKLYLSYAFIIYRKELLTMAITVLVLAGISSRNFLLSTLEWVFLIWGLLVFIWSILEYTEHVFGFIFYKYIHILKISRRHSRMEIRRKYFPKSGDKAKYMDCLMDDMFKALHYAQLKNKKELSLEASECHIVPILYCCSEKTKDLAARIKTLNIDQTYKTTDFVITRLEDQIDPCIRYIYHMIPKRWELFDEILKTQRRYQVTIWLNMMSSN